MRKFAPGDRVSWNTPQGRTDGKVVRSITSPCDIEGHHVVASRDEPQYLVESDSSGRWAAHHPSALRHR